MGRHKRQPRLVHYPYVFIDGWTVWFGFVVQHCVSASLTNNPSVLLLLPLFFTVVMSIGLLVDFLLHVLLRYYECPGTRYEKTVETLRTIGSSVLIGGITTCKCVVCCLLLRRWFIVDGDEQIMINSSSWLFSFHSPHTPQTIAIPFRPMKQFWAHFHSLFQRRIYSKPFLLRFWHWLYWAYRTVCCYYR
jgi:hypothetical protein